MKLNWNFQRGGGGGGVDENIPCVSVCGGQREGGYPMQNGFYM